MEGGYWTRTPAPTQPANDSDDPSPSVQNCSNCSQQLSWAGPGAEFMFSQSKPEAAETAAYGRRRLRVSGELSFVF